MRLLPASFRFALLSILATILSSGSSQAAPLIASTAAPAHWVGTWGASAVGVSYPSGSVPQSELVLQTVHVSRGGSLVRVVFTNEFGTDTLRIEDAGIAVAGKSGTSPTPSLQHLTFGGKRNVAIPAGAVYYSDPLPAQLPALSNLEIRLLLPAQPLHVVTTHTLGLQTNYNFPAADLEAARPRSAVTVTQWRFLRSVEVLASERGSKVGAGTLVAYGDSITDGYRSTTDANNRWPDVLAARLQASKKLQGVGVVNEGISGNRILHDGAGPNALARLDRDVLSQDDARYLIFLEAINDIGHTDQPRNTQDPVTVAEILAGITQITERAHAHGLRVYGATLTPFLGAGYASPAGEVMRQAVNDFIRHSRQFDGVIDFDKVTADPAHPDRFLPAFDSGDHLHPNDAGYKAMGDAIDLKLFEH